MTLFKSINDSIFEIKCEAIVNPVNTVGVMGAGLAKEFKKRYPNNFSYYKSFCDKNSFHIGDLLHFCEKNVTIINFPTKRHWKDSSKFTDIEIGVKKMVELIGELKLSSIAIPKLGCGLGGLNWGEVKPMLQNNLQCLTDVEIYFCE